MYMLYPRAMNCSPKYVDIGITMATTRSADQKSSRRQRQMMIGYQTFKRAQSRPVYTQIKKFSAQFFLGLEISAPGDLI